MNSIDQMIPQVDFLTKSGQAIPQLVNVFNEWYDYYSTDGKMLREDCARFVKTVTSARDDISIDDHRVNYLFSTYDYENQGYVQRDGFVSFYVEAARKPDKKHIVWENLRNMGYRNDLKRLDQPYELHNVDKNVLPRYNLSHNENFFNAIFKLQDSDENIAKEAFSFLCKITTNPIIYKNILNGKENWKNLLDAKNIYKLIYSLQIIESFLEDIEIDFTGVDSFANEESILNLDSNNLEIEEMKQLKIQWMRNFVSNDGFSHLVEVKIIKII
jgi:ubiquitin carboxyl-terminal hydrolase 34